MILQIIVVANFKIIESVIIFDQFFYIYKIHKIINRKKFIEINIMISYSYKNIVVSIIIINLLYFPYMLYK